MMEPAEDWHRCDPAELLRPPKPAGFPVSQKIVDSYFAQWLVNIGGRDVTLAPAIFAGCTRSDLRWRELEIVDCSQDSISAIAVERSGIWRETVWLGGRRAANCDE
jgi:hypothetical protein